MAKVKHKKDNRDRHLELSSKFMEMGHSLMKEGDEKKDYNISQAGSFFILIAGLMFSEEDVFSFSELCSMFSARKVLDNMKENNHLALMKVDDEESYQEMIKRINEVRKNNGLGPIKM